ncbi:MAG: hypothetical protein JWM26_1666 [Betaproteobacteria bacterium]|nr:hypothetical protein [Betaproteobacteria bacterium]
MIRFATVLFLFMSFAAGAAERAAAPGTVPLPPPGEYAGKLQEEGGSGTADVKLSIRDVTKDGRVTAHVQASPARIACGKPLPASGIMLNDGSMKLEVDAGAPDGCERVYNVKAAGGTVSGTYIEVVKGMKPKAATK